MQHEQFRNRVVRGLAWESGTKLGLQLLGWVSTIFVARILGPAAYGVVAIAGIYTLAIQIAVDYGPTAGLVTRESLAPPELRAAFWANLYFATALYVVLYAVAPLVGRLYAMPVLADVIRANGLAVFAIALRTVPTALALRALDYRRRALAELCGQATQTIALLVLALRGHGVWSLVWAFLLGQTVTTLAYLRTGVACGRPTFALRGIRDVASFGLRLTGSRLAHFAVSIADMAVVSWAAGARASGLYLMAQNLANLPLDKLGSILNRVTFPAIARLRGEPERTRAYFVAAHFWLLAFCAPLAVGAALVAPDLVALLFTSAWTDAGSILRLLCIAAAFRLSGMLMPPILEGLGRASLLIGYAALSAGCLVPAFVVGSLLGGVVGVAAAWALVSPLLWAWLVRRTLRCLDLPARAFFVSIVPVLVALAALIAAVLAAAACAPAELAPRLAAQIASGAIAYLAALHATVPTSRRAQLRSLAAELRSRSV